MSQITEHSPHVAAAVAKIAKMSSNDRSAFVRRQTNLEAFVTEKINPIELQIATLREELIPLYDEMASLREEARAHCTHPPELVSFVGASVSDAGCFVEVQCGFCDTVFHVNVDDVDNRAV
jgi:hypothetical protein